MSENNNTLVIDVDKLILIGDLHYGVHVNSLEWFEHQKNFIKNFLIPIIKEYNEKGITYEVWQFGDFFEQKQSLNVNIFNSVLDVFDELYKFINVFRMFLGNHDVYYIDNNEVNSPKILSRIYDKMHVISEPTTIKIKNKTAFIMPWYKDMEYIHQEIEKNSSDFLFTHLDINNFKYPSGVKVKNHLDPKILKKYEKVISGHIHIRQEMDNILYLGTPYQLEFSDINNTKGIYIMDTTTNELEFIENHTTPSYNELEFVDFINLPISTVKDIFNENSYLYLNIDYDLYKELDIVKFSKNILTDIDNIKTIKFIKHDKDIDDSGVEFKSVDIFDIAKHLLDVKGVDDKMKDDVLGLMNKLYEESKYKIKNIDM